MSACVLLALDAICSYRTRKHPKRRPEYLAEDSSCQEDAGGGEEKAR